MAVAREAKRMVSRKSNNNIYIHIYVCICIHTYSYWRILCDIYDITLYMDIPGGKQREKRGGEREGEAAVLEGILVEIH